MKPNATNASQATDRNVPEPRAPHEPNVLVLAARLYAEIARSALSLARTTPAREV